MPQIFDNIDLRLIDGLRNVLRDAVASSFCIGYLNLRGWQQVAELVERMEGNEDSRACRVLVGMHRPPEEAMKLLQRVRHSDDPPDGPTLARLKRRITESFKEQLESGVPTNEAEIALRFLARQLRVRKVFVKAFLRYPLHAKLYLIRRQDPVTPLIGFVGSSNLTLAGLLHQGELSVDVVEQDAAKKLQAWFNDRWDDNMSIDLSDQLAELIETSWARTELVRPYLVYLKIAHHLCEEAREGEREFRVPRIFAEKGTPLLDFQEKAVSLAAHHLHQRGGVLLGDVVGLGKTLMATAIARVMQEDQDYNTLVICPPKLVPLWDRHVQEYQITGRVLSLGKVMVELPNLPRYRLVIIDESHNLRNREARRYQAIQNYIERNESRVLLVTATPYNKQFTDISNQLRLFVDEDQDLHVRPEKFFRFWAEQGKVESDFITQFQTSPRSLRAFEQSLFPEDWRDLMRLYLVRRTRQFIMKHYAHFDQQRQRYYFMVNGSPFYFPVRKPKRVIFSIRENDPSDQYARLFNDDVVEVIENLVLPRYGLANFLVRDAARSATREEERVLANLTRAGRRLIGFCRTNLFKRLESTGYSFLLSVKRHVLRNLVTLYALEEGLHVPIGTQDVAMMDSAISDTEEEFTETGQTEDAEVGGEPEGASTLETRSLDEYKRRAGLAYQAYRSRYSSRFDWLDPTFFRPELRHTLEDDAKALLDVLTRGGDWNPNADAKLAALADLVLAQHPNDKVVVFTQFADTAQYLGEELGKRGLTDFAVATSETSDPVALARRFSPSTNGGLRAGERELRVLIATDVLAEGQNLQDCHIIVNYDLPWAIIRLIQRAGRVDRIGQRHDTITVYSFLPADGVERIIRLRQRLFYRLQQNQEVIGTDESFFGEEAANKLRDLYTEKAGTLDDDQSDEDIDIASLALQVWSNASADDRKEAEHLPPIVYSTRALPDTTDVVQHPPGVIAYLRYPDGADTLIRVDEQGNLISQSLSAVFRAAACSPDTPALSRTDNHHKLVARCVEIGAEEQVTSGGRLGSLRSTRRKLWERLNRYRKMVQDQPTLFSAQAMPQLNSVLDLIWRYPLKRTAQDAIGRQMRLGITDEELLELLVQRAENNNLCEIKDEDTEDPSEPKIICSLRLVRLTEGEQQ